MNMLLNFDATCKNIHYSLALLHADDEYILSPKKVNAGMKWHGTIA